MCVCVRFTIDQKEIDAVVMSHQAMQMKVNEQIKSNQMNERTNKLGNVNLT